MKNDFIKQFTAKDVMKRLESLASHDPKDLAGMARFGINVEKAWVISIPKLRALAKEVRLICNSDIENLGLNKNFKLKIKNSQTASQELHNLALAVWNSGVHEAQILAGFLDDPELVTEDQMEKWVLDFDSWDLCDSICGNLFDRTGFAVQKAKEWSERSEEFVKRAGFVLMAGLAVHNKQMDDTIFMEFLAIIKREATDERNFVRKAVNWALREIGKMRTKNLYNKALETAQEIIDQNPDSKSAKWIARDTIRELNCDYIKKRFASK